MVTSANLRVAVVQFSPMVFVVQHVKASGLKYVLIVRKGRGECEEGGENLLKVKLQGSSFHLSASEMNIVGCSLVQWI